MVSAASIVKEASIGDESRRKQAAVSRATAINAIHEAKTALEVPIDAKLKEISASQDRVTSQIKDLKSSISASQKYGKYVEDVLASFHRHEDPLLQHEVEQLDRDMRIIEYTQKLCQGQNW